MRPPTRCPVCNLTCMRESDGTPWCLIHGAPRPVPVRVTAADMERDRKAAIALSMLTEGAAQKRPEGSPETWQDGW